MSIINNTDTDAPAVQPAKSNRMVVTWHKAVDYLAPIGYEDDTGFHYGEMSALMGAKNRRKAELNGL